ncbi:MAG: 50S ribosome-binding GTPase [Caldilineaceae bacterium]|nr:50S ribosome-binding GTPase [Caldilineaceae bacterium]
MNKEQEKVSTLDAEAYEKSFAQELDAQAEEFKAITQSKLIISLIGEANAGKSATINALTGRKLSEVHPIAGWTKQIALHPYAENVFIADTPGLNEMRTLLLGAQAKDFVEQDADIILFFVNAASNRSPEEANAFRSIRQLQKPTIVVLNKIDTIEAEAVPAVVADLAQRLDYDQIVPISATKGIHIELLSNKIAEILSVQGKDLLFLKVARHKEERVKIWIKGAAISAFGIGALPLPGSDIVPLTALQAGLCMRIAYIYNLKVSPSDVMKLLGSSVTGVAGKAIYRNAAKLIADLLLGPAGMIASSAAAGAIAAAMTWGLGIAANVYYKSGMQVDLGELSTIYQDAFHSYLSARQ